ncbi:hypothetical protein [Streptomyces atratus]|uniref:hypothetical protein n=1 Tax=Streptomyces atratus TaxID=1893 RepID=UPI00324BFB14
MAGRSKPLSTLTFSLVLAVPLSAIGASTAHTGGLVVAWLGIVAVNAVHAARNWPWFSRRPGRADSDWEA